LYTHEVEKLRLELSILELGHEVLEFKSNQAVACAARAQESATRKKFEEARKKLGFKRRRLDELKSRDEEFSQLLQNTLPPQLLPKRLNPNQVRRASMNDTIISGREALTVTESTDPQVNANYLKAKFSADADKLLLKDLPYEVMRATVFREKGVSSTEELLEKVPVWERLNQLCCELSKDLCDWAVVALPVRERLPWVHNQLSSVEASVLPEIVIGAPWSVVEKACSILCERVDITLSRRVLVEKIGQAIDKGRLCANRMFAEHAVCTNKSSEGPGTPSLLMKYPRSEVKRAVAFQLVLNPDATDLEICRALDADGGVELPPTWTNSSGSRLFAKAYVGPDKHKVEMTISKVRADMRKLGLLSRR
jgi:hypothetical protein